MKLGNLRVWWPAGLAFGAFWIVAALATLRWLDADFGWHLESGRYILAHGVPQHDIFTYTAADYPWVNHEWLNDVLLAGLHGVIGYGGLGVVYAGLWTLAYGLAERGRVQPAVMGLSLAALAPYVGIRSMTWSAVGVAGVLALIERRRGWRWLPVVFALWANLHGGFVLGLLAVALGAAGKRSWRLAGWLGASGLATLINPYGWRLYGEIWQTMTDQQLHMRIVEWWPLTLDASNVGFMVAALGTVGLTRLDWPRQVLGALLILATLGANRQLPVLVLAMAEPIGRVVEGSMAAFAQARPQLAKLAGPLLAVLGLLLVPVSILWPVSTVDAQAMVLPRQAVAALRAEPCRGRLFNDYTFGGYVIWQLPGTKVYIDGRMPSWKGPEGSYYDRWERVLKDPGYAASEFERYGVKCALTSGNAPALTEYLRVGGWRKSVVQADTALWRRD